MKCRPFDGESALLTGYHCPEVDSQILIHRCSFSCMCNIKHTENQSLKSFIAKIALGYQLQLQKYKIKIRKTTSSLQDIIQQLGQHFVLNPYISPLSPPRVCTAWSSHRRSLPGGQGLPRAGADDPGRLSVPEVPGERSPAPLHLLVPGGRTAHLPQRRQKQKR